MDAIWHGHAASARVLLESGARSDLVALDGLTAASMAQKFKFDDITDLLKVAQEG